MAARVPLLLLASALAGCVTANARPPPMSFAEAGLKEEALPVSAGPRLSRLDAATEALLAAIERETGERPAIDLEGIAAGDDADAVDLGAARRRADGWNGERTALAMEVLRATDARQATLRGVQRARAALRWDLMLGARWTAVDATLVAQALTRIEAVLPPPVVYVQPPETVEGGAAFRWPVVPVRVTSGFGLRDDPFGEGTRNHRGVDLAAFEGQMVTAAADGVVIYSGTRGGYGTHVEVSHPSMGFISRYAHLSSAFVTLGSRLHKGEVIGRAGHTGRATGPHLHFELWREGLPLDPAVVLPEPAEPRYSIGAARDTGVALR